MGKSVSSKDIMPVDELLQKDELSVAETATALNVSRETVYAMIERGELKVSSKKTSARGKNISTRDVKSYIVNIQGRPLPGKSKK